MKRCEQSRSIVLNCCAIAGIVLLGGVAVSWAKCQYPNPNKIPCKIPDNFVTTCVGLNYTQCSYLPAVYDIKQFPDGSLTGLTFYTTQEQADCWRKQPCQWTNETGTAQCNASSWLPGGDAYYQAAKTVFSGGPECYEE